MNKIETKLCAARTRLILDKPFLGALVLHLPMIEADSGWCQTTATDARAFYYNRQFIADLSLEQTQFALSHEALHCALSHFTRRRHRDQSRWDIACDLAINPLLIAEALTPCPGAIHVVEYEGLTAEEIYPCLNESDLGPTHDHHLYNQEESDPRGTAKGRGNTRHPQARSSGEAAKQHSKPQTRESDCQPGKPEKNGISTGAPLPSPLSPNEQGQLSIQWSQRLTGAHQQALQAGKMGGGHGAPGWPPATTPDPLVQIASPIPDGHGT